MPSEGKRWAVQEGQGATAVAPMGSTMSLSLGRSVHKLTLTLLPLTPVHT